MQDYFPDGISNSTAKWDFGDGYTLSGTDDFIATHKYNVPGIYTVSVYLYNKDGEASFTSLTETVSIYNYADTHLAVDTSNITYQDGLTARVMTASQKKTFNLGVTASWQDMPNPTVQDQTIFFTASGSNTKPYDFNNKYAHLIPYNSFYDIDDNRIDSINGLPTTLTPHYFYVNTDNTITRSLEKDITTNTAVLLYSSTDEVRQKGTSITTISNPTRFSYYDDIPNEQVNLLIKLNTSKHKLKSFYVDGVEIDINTSGLNYQETDVARARVRSKATINERTSTKLGVPVKILAPFTSRLSFTSTGMKEMSGIQYKRQGDKFQVFVALADDKLNIGKYYSPFFHEPVGNFITLVNGNFSSNTSGTNADCDNAWTIDTGTAESPGGRGQAETGWDWSSGTASHVAHGHGSDNLYQDINTTLGNEYKITLTISDYVAGDVRVFLGTTDPTPPAHQDGFKEDGVYTILVDADNANPNRIFIQASQGFIGKVDDISIDCRQFYADWSDGSTTITSNISSVSTASLPFNITSNATELSSFLYLNIDPLEAGTWTLNITGRLDSFVSNPATSIGEIIDHDPDGPLGPVSIGVGVTVPPGVVVNNLITGSYTFTVFPSTNDTEVYKINEDIDYSEVLKSYRFQSLLTEYDNLFDGVFTSFVGAASSTPTSFGKTIVEKIANFTINNSDIDFCKIENIKSFYAFLNEEIDFTTPEPPPELKRLYNLFSIKISKLLGEYERVNENFDTRFYTSSAYGRNIDLTTPITSLTYEVTAGTSFIARQKFDNQYILIKPQTVPTIRVDGASSGVSTTYPLSTYNVYNNWGWPLDTTISGASGLDLFYEFYPFVSYDTTKNEYIQNSIIDFSNTYNSVTRSQSSLSANWEHENGIVFKNVDYQIRKGLQL
tara:strand:- start:1491 stop:4175 length:2685 start_codon:yes stop_codon:yes gene_type:complete